MNESLGLLETRGFTPAMVALDVMAKAAPIEVLQAELNDFLGVIIKISGDSASVAAAIEAGVRAAAAMSPDVSGDVIHRPDAEAWKAIDSPYEYNPLMQQGVVYPPSGENNMPSQALGFIETQGYTAVFDAIDTACKAARVEVVGKEKLGGGFITVVIRGDVAAVSSAIEAGRHKAEALGKVIAAHVIPNPSQAVLKLLPAVS
ncbi:MAG: BMC domain-containing protein [Planctomycetales bacterium]|nr:BMC domain-containing protein [Planctomycetales bacterium]